MMPVAHLEASEWSRTFALLGAGEPSLGDALRV
jgi:hypothetical protein